MIPETPEYRCALMNEVIQGLLGTAEGRAYKQPITTFSLQNLQVSVNDHLDTYAESLHPLLSGVSDLYVSICAEVDHATSPNQETTMVSHPSYTLRSKVKKRVFPKRRVEASVSDMTVIGSRILNNC